MGGVVYKQRYCSRTRAETPKHNVQHLKYIATRPGVIFNDGCGFGLWGRMGRDAQAKNIDSLKFAMAQMRRVSKEHTVYRAIVSLDEETAHIKGYVSREEWQALITQRITEIAKQNNMELANFRWCAAYHQERGHPHVHIMFWDDVNLTRDEYMGDSRFEIAAETIRASFNREIFKEELKEIRAEMDAAKKELRILSRNHVEGFCDLNFFGTEPTPQKSGDVRYYPKEWREPDVKELHQRLTELIALLPEAGQLKYQLLPHNVKAAVDAVSKIIIDKTSIKAVQDEIIELAKSISQTYGNSASSVQYQGNRAEKEVLKDVGNDILKTIKELGLIGSNHLSVGELVETAHDRTLNMADSVFQKKMLDEDFLLTYRQLLEYMPDFLTPRHEVFKDEKLAAAMRDLILRCMKDDTLKAEIKISQAFRQKDSEGACEEDKAVYCYLRGKIFDSAVEAKGWNIQEQVLTINNFLRHFCRVASTRNNTHNSVSNFLFLRNLSRQAQKERRESQRSTTNMWNPQL